MQVNWILVMYVVIGLFALSGFSRGWWREAITTIFLVGLVFLLQQPGVAQAVIEFINAIIARIWSIAPDFFSSIFSIFGVQTAGLPVQLDPGSAGTWLMVLVLVMVLANFVARLALGGRIPTAIGSLLGGLMGAFNGFLIISLVREYLDGRSLPGGGTTPATEIALAGGSTAGVASSGVSIQAVNMPRFTILDSIVPWIIIGIGLLVLIAIINTRLSRDGLNVRANKVPPLYK